MFKDAFEFAQFVGLRIDDQSQLYDDKGEFLGVTCPDCGGLRATVARKIMLERWLNVNEPNLVDSCPFCECEG